MRSYWIEAGPPLNIALIAIASNLGISFKSGDVAPEEAGLGDLLALIPERPRNAVE